MRQYIDLLSKVVQHGTIKGSRTGVGTLSLFGEQLRFDLQQGFPLVTTKKVHLRSIIHELLWFVNGDTNIRYLNDNGVKIWDEWATADGDLGPVYGAQWRNWDTGVPTSDLLDILDPAKRDGVSVEDALRDLLRQKVPTGIDQLKELITGLKTRPHSRRHIISAWNPAVLPDESISPQRNVEQGRMALAPCHTLVQFNVRQTPLSVRKERLAKVGINIKDFPETTPGYLDYVTRLEVENNLPTNHTLLDCQLYQR